MVKVIGFGAMKKSWSLLIMIDERFIKQHWVGYVESVCEEKREFVAILKDQTNKDNEDEETTVPMDDITDCYLPLIKVGGVFDWEIARVIDHFGAKITESKIIFRRIKGPSKDQLDAAKKEAEKLEELFSER